MIIVLLIAAILIVPAILLGGWITMLCLGGLASIFGITGLAIGFWPSCLVSIILGVLFAR